MNNLKKKKKKKGFTLVELMAVIAIIAILAAVLVPTVNGYINRSKKTAIITQIRTLVNAVESYNATSSTGIDDTAVLGDVTTANSVAKKLADAELIDSTGKDINKLATSVVTVGNYKKINEDTDSLNKLTYDKTNKVFQYIFSGTTPTTVSTTVN
ncbi:prepilin-type N-terminal cleavage/methylation domain-containing protein [Clostridioides difficile]